jgi:hypothetical protein
MQFTLHELTILRQAAEIILRAQDEPAATPSGFVVTRAWIEAYKTPAGAWKAKQLGAIGVRWPPASGWLDKACGQVITESNRAAFESFAAGTAPEPRARQDTARYGVTTSEPVVSCDCDVLPWDDCPHTIKT